MENKRMENNQKYVNILGINILSTNERDLLTAIEEKITHSYKLGPRSYKFSILTPNPELVLSATKNPLLKKALNSCDFAVPDGVGLNYASKFLYGKPVNIIPGRILFEKLIELANKKGWKVFLFGGWGNVADLAAKHLISLYPNILISSAVGPKLSNDSTPVTEVDKKLMKDAVDKINKFNPDLLFVAFGNPKQEIWIYKQSLPLRGKNLDKLNVRGMMAVGGTFRYISGLSPLPPKWMEQAGLEWLWRLFTEPQRLGRVLNASIIFPLKVFWSKITQ